MLKVITRETLEEENLPEDGADKKEDRNQKPRSES